MWPFGESREAAEKRREAEKMALRRAVVAKNDKNFYKGALGVAVTGTASVVAALTCRRSVVARRFRPNQFQANVLPPPFNPMKDAARAVCDATALASSLFLFGVASTFWVLNVGTLPELGQALRARYSTPTEIPVDDPESAEVVSYLSGLFSSSK